MGSINVFRKTNEGRIIEEYNKFYITNEFVKNQHLNTTKDGFVLWAEQLILTQIHLNPKAVTNNVLVLGILIKLNSRSYILGSLMYIPWNNL